MRLWLAPYYALRVPIMNSTSKSAYYFFDKKGAVEERQRTPRKKRQKSATDGAGGRFCRQILQPSLPPESAANA
ncbi:hypothetical protein KL86DES1_21708 [uncultured Desulfovibrio sp.]|uniref:Uncharacterized protein n=1 Tax=uncultured Desulfovibrio sp. TaxID=167968 RepID=A0A212L972_9BACT|nr:hypothetical protein KL86DES1_21708 [uncultured Desulfovibrio sp.]VZH34613.1 conserved protein of unknown function [Desulfovibrio sp. 86]